jgi:predicted aspartyl protease
MADDEKPRWTKIDLAQTVDDIFEHGPTLPIKIRAGHLKGGIVQVLALIDTGASATGLSPRLVQKLVLVPFDHGAIQEAGREPIEAARFEVSILLEPSRYIDALAVGLPSLAAPHDVIVGRDVLARCRLDVNFTTGVTSIHFKNP